ncbi:hypothetical protein AN643_04170 [Candidatus Epulonipiscioides saccharophilum]|nr:hypothetical protein AN643_04170 [Epulopiscium sp. SCG-B10WGA-EpuloB]
MNKEDNKGNKEVIVSKPVDKPIIDSKNDNNGSDKESIGDGLYTVQKNDSLWSIACEIYGDPLRYNDIYELNKDIIKSNKVIYPGQVLKLPKN